MNMMLIGMPRNITLYFVITSNTMRKFKYILIILLVVLCGCPIPFYYRIIDPDLSDYSLTFSNKIKIKLHAGHPWFDSNKKFIILNMLVINESNEKKLLEFSDIILNSRNDSFKINYGNVKAKNNFIVNQKSLELSPNQAKEVVLYFNSKKNYNKLQYKKSIQKDTLIYSIKDEAQKLLLVGEKN